MSASPTITLLGAAGEVTGSCTLLDCGAGRVLVDFGLFQGAVTEEWRNTEAPAIEFGKLTAVIVTHAHVDHCGRLGMLPSLGYRGPVFCTEPTARLLPRVLRGSASLQSTRLEEFRRGTAPVARVIDPPPDPEALARLVRTIEPPVMYDHAEAEAISSRIEACPYDAWRPLAPGLRMRLHEASHILGSASVELECELPGGAKRRILFSGDLGPTTQSVLRPRGRPPEVDAVVMESTNGLRVFGAIAETEEKLAAVFDRAASSRSRILMPTFSIGRAQQLVHRIAGVRARGRLHGLPVYIDSPMAVFASELHQKFPALLASDLARTIASGGSPLHFDELHFLYSRKQSLKVQASVRAACILAGSGFCDAGPILHHLAGAIEDPATELVLTGHQIEGTLGHGLAGEARLVLIEGRELTVRARRTRLEGLSGHADQRELLEWIRSFAPAPGLVILNHGGEKARAALAPLIRHEVGAEVVAPEIGVAVAI